MMPESWLEPSLILLDLPADTLAQVLQAVARAAATVTGLDAARIEGPLQEKTLGGGFALGQGVAVPHADIPGLTGTAVALVRTRQPVPVPALDGSLADLFFVVLARPGDPKGHLLLLAHLARLARNPMLRDGLRQAHSVQEAMALVQAAALRHAPGTPSVPSIHGITHYLAVIAVAGELVVDALLVSLLDQRFGDASIMEAQSLREAATREVPLFAGFRDIFGDPGGQRVLLLEVPADRIDALATTVRRVFEEHAPGDGRLALMPLQSYWQWEPPRDEQPTRGH